MNTRRAMMRVPALIALLLLAVLGTPARAQSLQRLTVTQLTLSANTTAPRIEVPFDLIITAHVRERITELRNLDLPYLSDVELLGDEHSLVSSGDGTTYTEHVRVVAHHSGLITFAPATLDAIDARDGKSKRYSSNSLSLAVGGAVTTFTQTFDVTGAVFTLLRWLLVLVLALLVVRLVVRRRRRAAVTVSPQPAVAPISPPLAPTREQRLRDARTVLAAERTRGAVLRVRTIVREMVGAGDDETLADVLRRIEPQERNMRALLFALERASFTHDGDLAGAVDHVIDRLSDMVGPAS